ncbi:MAG: hypothetical protein ACYTF0_03250, partial [Planctomycetota bacterium]
MTERDERVGDLLAAAWLAFHRGDCGGAIKAARSALALDSVDGRSHYALACALERDGRMIDADCHFRRAANAMSEPQPAPYRVSWR